MAIKAVIVEHRGSFWRLTVHEWMRVLHTGIQAQGYVLPPHARLKHRPRYIRVDARAFYSTKHHYPLFRPADWLPQDFGDAIVIGASHATANPPARP